jgi:hypothetical protein
MWHLVVAWVQSSARRDKAEAAVFNFEPAAIKPQQPVSVRVRDASLIEPETT